MDAGQVAAGSLGRVPGGDPGRIFERMKVAERDRLECCRLPTFCLSATMPRRENQKRSREKHGLELCSCGIVVPNPVFRVCLLCPLLCLGGDIEGISNVMTCHNPFMGISELTSSSGVQAVLDFGTKL